MQQITVRLPDEMVDNLEVEAEMCGLSRSEHIRSVLESRHDRRQLERRNESLEERIEQLEYQLSRSSHGKKKV